MPRMLRRAAVLGGTAHLASKRGAAKAQAAQQAAAPAAPTAPAAPVAEAPVAEAPAPEAQADQAPAAASADPYANLMKLKELLDAGVLTQEEFDAEKKKILAG